MLVVRVVVFGVVLGVVSCGVAYALGIVMWWLRLRSVLRCCTWSSVLLWGCTGVSVMVVLEVVSYCGCNWGRGMWWLKSG